MTGDGNAVRYCGGVRRCRFGIAEAETRFEEAFAATLTAVPLETRGLIAEWDAEEGGSPCSGTKVLFFNRRALAPMLGLAEPPST